MKVVGAQYIVETVERQKPFGDLALLPLLSRTFDEVEVSTTGFTSDERDRLLTLVRLMRGRVTTGLNQHTTHLVAHSAGSVKYRSAINSILPIVTSEWVSDCFDGLQLKDVAAYVLRPFHNFVICLSGFSETIRDQVQSRIKKLGGELTVDMRHMTHLVVGKDYLNIKKYNYALQNDIPITCVDWVFSCAEQKIWLPEDKYPIDLAMFDSSQVSYLAGCDVFLLGFTAFDLEYLQKEIQMGGGTVAATCAEATHVIVDSNLEEGGEKAKELYPHIPFVHNKWLFVCKKEKKVVPTQPFEVYASEKRESGNPNAFRPHDSPYHPPAPSSRILADSYGSAARPLLFHGLYFIVFHKKGREEVRDRIVSQGGQAIYADEYPAWRHSHCRGKGKELLISYIVFLLGAAMQRDSTLPSEATCVTTRWLENSIEAQSFLDVNESVLYPPLPFVAKHYRDCMRGVSVHLEGWDGSQDVDLTLLAQCLTLKATPFNAETTTHVILNPEKLPPRRQQGANPSFALAMQRYKEAYRNVFVVTKDWLEQCALQGKQVNEMLYRVHKDLGRSTFVTDTESESSLNPSYHMHQDTLAPHITNDELMDVEPSQDLGSLLRGVVVFLGASVNSQQERLIEVARELGAEVGFSFDMHCITHYIHQSESRYDRGVPDKHLKKAKDSRSIIVVSPQWLYDCKSGRCRLPEGLYPSTKNPHKALDFIGDASALNVSQHPTKPAKKRAKGRGDVIPVRRNPLPVAMPSLRDRDLVSLSQMTSQMSSQQIRGYESSRRDYALSSQVVDPASTMSQSAYLNLMDMTREKERDRASDEERERARAQLLEAQEAQEEAERVERVRLEIELAERRERQASRASWEMLLSDQRPVAIEMAGDKEREMELEQREEAERMLMLPKEPEKIVPPAIDLNPQRSQEKTGLPRTASAKGLDFLNNLAEMEQELNLEKVIEEPVRPQPQVEEIRVNETASKEASLTTPSLPNAELEDEAKDRASEDEVKRIEEQLQALEVPQKAPLSVPQVQIEEIEKRSATNLQSEIPTTTTKPSQEIEPDRPVHELQALLARQEKERESVQKFQMLEQLLHRKASTASLNELDTPLAKQNPRDHLSRSNFLSFLQQQRSPTQPHRVHQSLPDSEGYDSLPSQIISRTDLFLHAPVKDSTASDDTSVEEEYEDEDSARDDWDGSEEHLSQRMTFVQKDFHLEERSTSCSGSGALSGLTNSNNASPSHSFRATQTSTSTNVSRVITLFDDSDDSDGLPAKKPVANLSNTNANNAMKTSTSGSKSNLLESQARPQQPISHASKAPPQSNASNQPSKPPLQQSTLKPQPLPPKQQLPPQKPPDSNAHRQPSNLPTTEPQAQPSVQQKSDPVPRPLQKPLYPLPIPTPQPLIQKNQTLRQIFVNHSEPMINNKELAQAQPSGHPSRALPPLKTTHSTSSLFADQSHPNGLPPLRTASTSNVFEPTSTHGSHQGLKPLHKSLLANPNPLPRSVSTHSLFEEVIEANSAAIANQPLRTASSNNVMHSNHVANNNANHASNANRTHSTTSLFAEVVNENAASEGKRRKSHLVLDDGDEDEPENRNSNRGRSKDHPTTMHAEKERPRDHASVREQKVHDILVLLDEEDDEAQGAKKRKPTGETATAHATAKKKKKC